MDLYNPLGFVKIGVRIRTMQTIIEFSVASDAKTRAEELKCWLLANAPECFRNQEHLNEGSAERVYWHYGYLSALQDVLRLLAEANTSQRGSNEDTSDLN